MLCRRGCSACPYAYVIRVYGNVDADDVVKHREVVDIDEVDDGADGATLGYTDDNIHPFGQNAVDTGARSTVLEEVGESLEEFAGHKEFVT